MNISCGDWFLVYYLKGWYRGLQVLGIKNVQFGITRKLETGLGNDSSLGIGFFLKENENLKKVKQLIQKSGVNISAVMALNNFCNQDIESEIDYLVTVCEIAKEIGTNVVRIDTTGDEKDISIKQALSICQSAIEKVLKDTEKIGVNLAIENHCYFANQPEFLKTLFDTFKSERLGLTLDTSNFFWYGYPLDEVYGIIENFASYVKHTHIKNATSPDKDKRRKIGDVEQTPIYSGDIDIAKIARILKNANYKGTLNLEDESLTDNNKQEWDKILKKDIEYLRTLL